jgi:hypothetical protein
MGRRTAKTIVLLGSAFLLATEADAQYRTGPGGDIGISFVAADAIGALDFTVDQGFGLEVQAGLPIAADGHLRLRMDGGFLIYGIEQILYCDYGCRVGSQLTTTNSMVYGGVGPELVLGRGGFRPYVHASAGASWFVTSSSLDDRDGYGPYLETTNFWDVVFSWKFGGGLRFGVGGSERTFIDMGVVLHNNGVTNYLTRGDIVDNPDGTVTLYPNRSDADFLSFKLGVTFALY